MTEMSKLPTPSLLGANSKTPLDKENDCSTGAKDVAGNDGVSFGPVSPLEAASLKFRMDAGTGSDFDQVVATEAKRIKEMYADEGMEDFQGCTVDFGDEGKEQPKVEPKAAKPDVPVVEKPAPTTGDVAALKKDVPTISAESLEQRRIREVVEKNMEKLPKFEQLTQEQLRRYELYRSSFHKLLPLMRLNNSLGSNQENYGKGLAQLRENETNPDRIKLIDELIVQDPFTDRTAGLQKLKKLFDGNVDATKVIDTLLKSEDNKENFIAVYNQIIKGEQTDLLMEGATSNLSDDRLKSESFRALLELHKDDPAITEIIKDNFARHLIQELKKQPNHQAATSPAFVELANLLGADETATKLLLDFKKGTAPDALTKIEEKLKNGSTEFSQLRNKVKESNYSLTMSCYRQMAQFLNTNMPKTITTLGSNMMIGTKENKAFENKFPDNCPIQLPQIQAGDKSFPAIWEGFLHKLNTGEAKVVLPEDPAAMLKKSSELNKVTHAADWWLNAEVIISRNQRINDATELSKLMKDDFGVGAGWDMPPVTDAQRLDAWYSAATDMSNLMHRMKNYVQAYKTLDGIAPDIDRDGAIKELVALGAVIEFDKYGKITKFELPMPENLNLKHPTNSGKVQQWENWLAKHKGPVDKAADAYQKGHTSYLRYGDFVEPPSLDGKKPSVVFDKDNPNKMVMILDNQGKPRTLFVEQDGKQVPVHKNRDGKFILEETTSGGEKVTRELKPDMSRNGNVVDFDYTSESFTSKRVKDEKSGKEMIEVTVTRMYCQDGKANYQYIGSEIDSAIDSNLCEIKNGRETVTFRVPPDTYMGVVHNTTGRMELHRADGLDGWWRWRQKYLFHYGSKVANTGLDLGLLVSGSIEALTAKSLLAATLPAARAMIGAAGFMSPALRNGWSPFGIDGKTWLEWKHWAMAVDVYGIGIGGGLLRMMTGGAKTIEAAGVLQRIANQAHLATNVTGFLYAPVIAKGIQSKWSERQGTLPDQRIPRAMVERGISESDFSTFNRYDLSDVKVRNQTVEMLTFFNDSLKSSTDNKQTQEKLDRLLAEAKDILALPKDDPRRQKFVEKLIGYYKPSAATVLAARMTDDPSTYTNKIDQSQQEDAASEAGGKKNREQLEQLRKQPTLEDVSEQEKIAAAQLLILLNADKDGKLPTDGKLGSRTLTLDDHFVKVNKASDDEKPDYEWQKADDNGRKVEQSFTVDEAMAFLKKQVSTSVKDTVSMLAGYPEASASKYLQLQLGIDEPSATDLVKKLKAGDAATKEALIEKLNKPIKVQELATADSLWRLGKLTNREMAAVCLDIVSDAKLPQDIRAKALLDPTGYRLGHLLQDLKLEEKQLAGMGSEKIKALGNINGARAADIERVLLQLIAQDGNRNNGKAPSDLRAMASQIMAANRLTDASQRLTALNAISDDWNKFSAKPGSYANEIYNRLTAKAEQNPATAKDKSADEVRQEKLEATLLLSALGRVELQDGKVVELTREKYNQLLLECTAVAYGTASNDLMILATNPEITHEVLRSLDFDKLSIDQRKRVLALLDTAIPQNPQTREERIRRRDVEIAKIAIFENLTKLIGQGQTGGDFDVLRASAREKVLTMFDHKTEKNVTSTFVGACPDLRFAAISAVRDIGWRDLRMKEMLEYRLYRGPASQDSTDMIFYEVSPAVRRVALEALWKMNPQNPGEIALNHRDYETDPAVGRLAKSEEGRMYLQKLGDARQISEQAQKLQLEMDKAFQCNLESGNSYIENSDFKILKEKHLDSSIRAAGRNLYGIDIAGSMQDGYFSAEGMRFGVLFDRVTELDWDAPKKKFDGAIDGVFDKYKPMSVDLCRQACKPGGTPEEMKKQADSINAIAYLLKTNAKECFSKDQHTIRMNSAFALVDLCGAELKLESGETIIIPQKVRDMAFAHIRNLMTDSAVDARVRLCLLDGLKRLYEDGAIDMATAAEITTSAIKRVVTDRNFRQPNDPDRKADETLQAALLEDLLLYRGRAVDPLSVVKACAANHPYDSNDPQSTNVKKRAQEILSLLENGVTLTREDVRATPDTGSTPDMVAQSLQAAIEKPGERNENLIREIFRASSGVPITGPEDPRLHLLVKLGQTHADLRVRAAVAHALLDVSGDDGKAALMAFAILHEVANSSGDNRSGMVLEAKEKLKMVEKLGEKGKEFLKDLDAAAKNRSSGALRLIDEIESFKQRQSDEDLKKASTTIIDMLRRDRGTTDKPDSSSFVRAIIEPWAAVEYGKVPDELLEATTRVLNMSSNPQAQLAAAYVLLRAEGVSDVRRNLAKSIVTNLAEKSTNEAVKTDAKILLDAMKDGTLKISPEGLLFSSMATDKRAGALSLEAAWIRNSTEQVMMTKRSYQTELAKLDLRIKEGLFCNFGGMIQNKAKVEALTIEQRVDRLKKAISNPGSNNNELISAVLESMLYKPVEKQSDERLKLVLDVVSTTKDLRVQEACALALIISKAKDAYTLGTFLLADVQLRGPAINADEAKQIIDIIAAKQPQDKEMVNEMYKGAQHWNNGAMLSMALSKGVLVPGMLKQGPLDRAGVSQKIKNAKALIEDPTSMARHRTKAMFDALLAGGQIDPTGEFLPLCRDLAANSKDQQLRLTAAVCILSSLNAKGATAKDLELVESTYKSLAESAKNPFLREEAKMVYKQFQSQKKDWEKMFSQRTDTEKLLAKADETLKERPTTVQGEQDRRKQLLENARNLERALYGLPKDASDADLQAARDNETKREAAKLGIKTDMPIEDLRKRVSEESHKRYEKATFDYDCKQYGLDPATATKQDIDKARTKKMFEYDCKQYGLDPASATNADLQKARERKYFELDCKNLGLDPSKATNEDLAKARERRDFEFSCKMVGLDASKATKEDLTKARERRDFEDSCKLYELDPAKTTKEQLDARRKFFTDCFIYNLDPKIATQEQVNKARFVAECKIYQLDPNKVSQADLDKAKEEGRFKGSCFRYRLDPSKTSREDLHNARCAHFNLPSDTKAEKLDELEIKENGERSRSERLPFSQPSYIFEE